ncbi:MAG TPA: PAS domain S-box protein [Terriglobia bacterium]|nr:PAS domain S-box protein [Terriglobia bacterium]
MKAEREPSRDASQERLPAKIQSTQEAPSPAAADSFSIVDRDWRLKYVSDSIPQMTGLDRAQLLGKNIWDLFPHLRDTRLFVEFHRALAQRRPARVEFFHTPANRWFEHRAYPCEDGLAVFSADITERKGQEELLRLQAKALSHEIIERKRAENALRETQERLEERVEARTAQLLDANETLRRQAQLLDLAHDAIIVRTLDSSITFWNRGAESKYGWTREEAGGRISHDLLRTKFPEPFEEVQRGLLQNGYWEGELVQTRRDGARIVVASRQAVQRDEQGQPVAILAINRDITRHKQAEEALRESEQRLLSIMDSSPAVMFIKDRQGRYVYVNPRFETLCGLPPAEVIGKKDSELFPLPQADAFRANDLKVLLSETAIEFEEVAVHDDGPHTSIVTKFPLRDTRDNVHALCGIVTDITERKRAEEALQRSEARLRAVIESMDDVALEIDGQGVYLNVWTTNQSLLPRPKKEIIGQRVGFAFGEGFARPILEAITRVIAGGPAESLEYAMDCPEGRRWFLGRMSAIRSELGARKSVCLLVREITDLKRTEVALRENHAFLEKLFESSPDAILTATTEGTINRLNAQAEKLFGYRRAELLGKSIEVLVPERFRDRHPVHREHYRNQPRIRPMGVGIELYGRRKDGTEFPVDIMLGPIEMDRDPLVLTVVRDITDRKRAEESVREVSGRLLQLQDEERRRLARELHDSTAQTLSAITLNLSVVKRYAGFDKNARAFKALAESLDLARDAGRELRTMSYLLHPPLLDEVGLAQALRWYEDGFVERTGIRVSLEMTENLARLPSDLETALFRIVQECLTNIHRHSGSPTAEIRLAQDTEWMTLEVRDRGEGLSAETLQQVNSAASTLGVGIRGMQERVRQLGGRIELTLANPGTLVRTVVPLTRDDHTPASPTG